MKISILFLVILPLIICHISEEEIAKTIDEKIITCGSVLRIQNLATKFQYIK